MAIRAFDSLSSGLSIGDVETASQTGAAAAITAAGLEDAAGIQTACEAAITARTTTLAAAITGGGFATMYALANGDGLTVLGNIWRSCVSANENTRAGTVSAIEVALADDFAAIPDTTEIQAASSAAILAKFPALTKVEVEVTTFDDPKVLIAGVGGQVLRVYGLLMTTGAQAGVPMQTFIQDTDGTALTGSTGLEIAYAATDWFNAETPLYTLPTGKGIQVSNPGSATFLCTLFYTQG